MILSFHFDSPEVIPLGLSFDVVSFSGSNIHVLIVGFFVELVKKNGISKSELNKNILYEW